jgi:hypothetical protein
MLLPRRSFSFPSERLFLLLGLIAVSSHKLLDTTCGIHEFLLACIERMAKSADFAIDHVVLYSIDRSRRIGLHCRSPNPLMFSIHEQYGINGWVNSFFHNLSETPNIPQRIVEIPNSLPIYVVGNLFNMNVMPVTPLPPTAATLLLLSRQGDTRTALTVIASDMMVSRTLKTIVEFLGFESNLPHLVQIAGQDALTQLAIAADVWISGSRVKCKVVSASQLSLGSLVIGCLTPMALEQDLSQTDAQLQIRSASFGLFSTLAYSLVARQFPEEFESAASIAQFRQIPIASVYQHVTGRSIQQSAGFLANAWGLTRELTIALQGPEGFQLDRNERMIISATEIATMAAQSAAVSVEPWPFVAKSDSIEQIALIQAMGMRAKRVAAKLSEEIEVLRPAA